MRVCFLFNHPAAHQVAHAAPFAFELSRRAVAAEVVVATTSDEQERVALRIAAGFPGHRVQFVRLGVAGWQRVAARALIRFTFVEKSRVLERHVDFFRNFDAIVSPERHVLKLRSDYGLRDVRIINTRHGQGDRSGSFDARTRDVDLTLLAGRKYVDRLFDHGFLREGHYAIVGYPKFESCRATPPARIPFAESRPIVLYNPHFDQRESSWQTEGRAVLEWFAARPEYNLVFAPHVVLFKRSLRHAARVPLRARAAPNIWIDTGSEASLDMTYTRLADVYLGDVSSQVYEFIARPRPCVFLDAHGLHRRDSRRYAHWAFGPVIERADQLKEALALACARFETFAKAQREGFAYTFSEDPERTSAERGADAIAEFLRKGRIESSCYLAQPAPGAPLVRQDRRRGAALAPLLE